MEAMIAETLNTRDELDISPWCKSDTGYPAKYVFGCLISDKTGH